MESFFASAAADSVGSACVLLLVVLAYKLYKIRMKSNCHNDFCSFTAENPGDIENNISL
jgi:hypothetical protein